MRHFKRCFYRSIKMIMVFKYFHVDELFILLICKNNICRNPKQFVQFPCDCRYESCDETLNSINLFSFYVLFSQ